MNGRDVLRRFHIGQTPLVPLPGLVPRGQVNLKAEYENPFGSVKDRTAAYLLAWACRCYGSAVRITESTSGNLGVALVRIGARLGVRSTLVMDASLPAERIEQVRGAGGDVELAAEARPGMTFRETRIAIATELGRRAGSVWLNQYGNPAGMRAHEETTGPEIVAGCPDGFDAVVASVGTGGTICGIGAALRDLPHPPLVVGAEPVGSTISGGRNGDYLPAGSGMRGPPDLVRRHGGVIDLFAQVPDAVAARWALTVSRLCGTSVGQTTGAAVAVAARLANRDGLRVVVVAPDRGQTFLPAMRRLAAQASTEPDEEQIAMREFRIDADTGGDEPERSEQLVAAEILDLISKHFSWVTPADGCADPTHRLREDFDLDSLHLVELQVAVEDRFNVAFDPLDERLLDAFATVGSMAAYVRHLIGRGA